MTNASNPSQQRLWKFHGGLHLPDNKALANGAAITAAKLPKRLILPLQQHIGAPAKPLVQVGDEVLKGQMIARPDGFVSVPLHAPTSGKVIAIEEHPVPHPSGMSAPCIVIEPDGKEQWIERKPVTDYTARYAERAATISFAMQASSASVAPASPPSSSSKVFVDFLSYPKQETISRCYREP